MLGVNEMKYIILALNTKNDEYVFKYAGIEPIREFVSSYEAITKGDCSNLPIARVEERSYLVHWSEDAINLAKAYDQESIIVLNGDYRAELVILNDNRVVFEGKFKNVGNFMPDTAGVNESSLQSPLVTGWTYDIESGNYYILT